MTDKKSTLPYKKIRVIQFLFKSYLDKTTAKKYYAVVNLYQKTGNEHLLAFIKEEILKIKALPEFDPSKIKR